MRLTGMVFDGFWKSTKTILSVLEFRLEIDEFLVVSNFCPTIFEKFQSDIESFNLLIIIYSVFNLDISKGFSLMDTRLVVIAAPLLVAASWALFNIGRLAIQQIQRLGR